MPTFGSLFAGIGGIDLGLERAGWTGRWQVEWDDYCRRVLAKHWPDVARYGDVHDVHGPLAHAAVGAGELGVPQPSQRTLANGDGEGHCDRCLEPVDLIAGGFPCQPFSFAGKQQRLADDRWLWPEFERCVRELRPRYVLVENVPGLLVGGGMDAVLGGLADLGYDSEWESIPAAAVGAPHLRYRVWIVAHRQGDAPRPDADGAGLHRAGVDEHRDAELRDEQVSEPRSVVLEDADRSTVQSRRGRGRAPQASDAAGTLANADIAGPQGRPVQPERAGEWAARAGGLEDAAGEGWRPAGDAGSEEAEAWGPFGGAGRSGWWSTEPDVGRVAHGVPARVDRLKALGNAVVPQVVEWIGRRILEAEGLT